MNKCVNCKWYFRDDSVGYTECTKADDFSDEQYEEYEEEGSLEDCPYYEVYSERGTI